jgi:head-tail adaptor
MGLLTAADIASMRGTVNTSLPDTAIIQAGTISGDSGGGGTTTWNAAGTVACRLSPLTGTERDVADHLAEDAKWLITVPAATAVTTDSRVLVGSATFEVLALRAPRSWEVSRQLEVQEVR